LVGFLLQDVTAPEAPACRAVEWEESNCPLCDSDRWTHLIEAPDNIAQGDALWFAVVRCKDCGLCFTNPRPSFESIRQFYPPAYFPGHAPRERSRRRWERMRRWLRRPNPRKSMALHGEGRLLDFGCGGGSFLARMHRQGWQVTGIDIASDAIEHIRRDLGLKGLVGTLPHRSLRPASFDVITMWHSLEHVHNPLEVLREAYFLLAPGGKLLVGAPNIDSLPFQWFGRAWYGLDLPRHLTHFNPQTLTWMLERAGFRIGRMRMVKQTGWLRSSAMLGAQRPDRKRWYGWLQGKTGSRLASWYSCFIGRGDCMMVTAYRGD
jgi:2-polyprenyl-3-methyl-5-hydroxy-6-metoxy-1,4-benzoquinol methylase